MKYNGDHLIIKKKEKNPREMTATGKTSVKQSCCRLKYSQGQVSLPEEDIPALGCHPQEDHLPILVHFTSKGRGGHRVGVENFERCMCACM